MQQFHVESLGMMAHIFDSEHELKTNGLFHGQVCNLLQGKVFPYIEYTNSYTSSFRSLIHVWSFFACSEVSSFQMNNTSVQFSPNDFN